MTRRAGPTVEPIGGPVSRVMHRLGQQREAPRERRKRLSRRQIDELKARTDIVSVVGARIKLKRSGKGFAALCPFHTEKRPSFLVSPNRQTFLCFSCGARGDAIDFICKFDSVGFLEAVSRLRGA